MVRIHPPLPNMTKVVIPYEPRPWQLEEHNNIDRFTVLVVHRRAGKTVFAVNELIKRVFKCDKNRPQVAYIAPTYRQAKQVSWEIFKQMVEPIPGVKINESELRIDFPNGGRILVLGAENPDSLRGLYLDYAVLDEVADMPAQLWNTVVRPALADRQGGALFIGTPKGKNFFHDLYVRGKGTKNWKSTLLTWRETKALGKEEVEDMRLELTQEEFEQELECSFTAAIRGAYFGKQIAQCESDGRIKKVPYDADYPVVAAWDIGFDGTSVWYAQFIMDEIRIIDFDHFEEKDIPYCANIVLNKPYVYSTQILPHDAAKRSNLDSTKTPKNQIEKLGLKCRLAARADVNTGINEARRLIAKAQFDIDKCASGLESLRQYRAQYDESKGVFQQNPVHDKHSHPADAFRTLAMGYKNSDTNTQQRRVGVQGSYNPYNIKHTIVNQYNPYEYRS